jgi:hypothetical protein
MQTALAQQSVTGTAGGGMVTVAADGRGRVRSVRIDPSLVRDPDIEMLEDLVAAAVADAQRKADEVYRTELKKITGGLPLPFQLPL